MGSSQSARRFLTLLFLLPPAGVAWSQDTMYVTDILQLGMHHAQDTSDEAFRNIVSGTEVTVLERATDTARVRTADGAEGWVRSFYLIPEQPARARVAELEARVGSLEQENQAYFERFERYRGTVPWFWVLGAVVVALAGGILAGYWWLDATIRRRYGGFRMH
jgi:hypothetical protein